MEHIAIDLGGRESQICVREESGTILEQGRYPTARLGEYLRRRPAGRVVLETSSEAFAVADEARKAGHQIRVVPATLVKSLGVGARGVKTDKRDAQALSEASCRIDLPCVHVPSELARERKALCGMRECLVKCRTELVNNARSYLRTKVKGTRKGSPNTFPKRMREKCPQGGSELPSYLERQLKVIEALNQQITAANQELSEIAEKDEVCRRLMSVPGVGPCTAIRFVASVDGVERFGGAHRLESYFGTTPGERSSSTRECRTSITKAGSAQMRWLLVQAAWSALRTRPNDPMVIWAKQVALRRGPQIAVTALARKMAGILFAIWRDGTPYQPSRGACAG